MAGFSILQNTNPVGTLAQLAEVGLDPTVHASCSEPKEVDQPGKGRTVVNQGCVHWFNCPWKQRHNVAVRIIKPSSRGKRRIRENWMSCAEYLAGPSRWNGHNGVIVEVFGGEGAKVTLRGSLREEPKTPGSLATFKPSFWKEPVPVILSPADNPALVEDAAAAEMVKSAQERDGDAARRSALGLTPAAPAEETSAEAQPDA